jgi:DNA-binding SARP family transcriptional activator
MSSMPASTATAMASPIELCVLGRFSVRCGGVDVALHPQHRRVIAFLALRDRPVSRAVVAGTLWPMRSGDRAAGALRSALWHVDRRAPDLLAITRTELAVAPGIRSDLDALRDAMKLVDEVTPDDLPPVGALRDDLLPDWDEEWLVFERERIRQQRLRALEQLCRRHTDAARFGPAIHAGLIAVDSEPLRESAQRVLIAAHLAEGNRFEAVRQFHSYESVLMDDMGVRPSDDFVRMIYGETVAGELAYSTSASGGSHPIASRNSAR